MAPRSGLNKEGKLLIVISVHPEQLECVSKRLSGVPGNIRNLGKECGIKNRGVGECKKSQKRL